MCYESIPPLPIDSWVRIVNALLAAALRAAARSEHPDVIGVERTIDGLSAVWKKL